jgi:uncharacterized protein (DUF302 family)
LFERPRVLYSNEGRDQAESSFFSCRNHPALGCAALPRAGARTAEQPAPDSGIVRVKSAFGVAETIARIKKDIAAKGIEFFDEIDQGKLAAGAGIILRPSILLIFGNPPLGIQFLTANAYSGLDWPVRMLVLHDSTGQVWIA